jgi:hypothetical protein
MSVVVATVVRALAALAALASLVARAASDTLPGTESAATTTVSADVRLLPWRREVQLGPARAGIWAEVWDDSALAAGTANAFADLRLTDDHGVAHQFVRREPTLYDAWYRRLDAATHRREGDREIVQIDLGARRPIDLAVEVQHPWYGGQVVVQASDDSTHWRDVAYPGAGPFAQSGPPQMLDHGAFSDRWVRVVVSRRHFPRPARRAGMPEPLPQPLGPSVLLYERAQRRTAREPVPFRVARTSFEGRTWIAELEIESPPVGLCRLVVSPHGIRHDVRVEGRLPEGGWRELTRATIESVPLADGTLRTDAIEWDPYRTASLRVHVEGADAPNAPVAIDSLLRTPERFVFPVIIAGERRWLAYGDAQVVAADAALDPRTMSQATFVRAALGPVEANPFYRPPGFGLSWLQRHPTALTVALVAILALVAALVLRPARRGRIG